MADLDLLQDGSALGGGREGTEYQADRDGYDPRRARHEVERAWDAVPTPHRRPRQ